MLAWPPTPPSPPPNPFRKLTAPILWGEKIVFSNNGPICHWALLYWNGNEHSRDVTSRRFPSTIFEMIAQPQRKSGKTKAICRTSRESRGNGGGLGEVLGRCGWVGERWGRGGSSRLAGSTTFLAPTMALAASRWRSASTLVISSRFCRWLILPSNQD